MFELCLFDLDQTLVDTSQIENIRLQGLGAGMSYDGDLLRALTASGARRLYRQAELDHLREAFPDMKLGVFTRSPRRYADLVLNWAYPGFAWDIVVAYEDVRHTKPSGEGISTAMVELSVEDVEKVVLVGDNLPDVRAAYNAGCWIVLDRSNWPAKLSSEHWYALERIPDAIITRTAELPDFLASPCSFLPELERRLANAERAHKWARFDMNRHLPPKSIEEVRIGTLVYSAGKFFANYESLQYRREWHNLTASIQDCKDATSFPIDWINVIRTFVNRTKKEFDRMVVSVIPHRPGRRPRLEEFLGEVEEAYQSQVGRSAENISFVPDLLAYRKGVRSNSNDHLTQSQRYENVRDHLYVTCPEDVNGDTAYLVIDDVATSGASFFYVKKYLEDAGAKHVICFALAKNISDVQ